VTSELVGGPGRHIVASVIVVVAHGKALDESLGSVVAQTLDPTSFELVVVDVRDGAHQGDVRELAHHGPSLRVLTAPGATADEARTIGLDSARGEHALFVDESARLAPGLLRQLVDAVGPGVVPVACTADADVVAPLLVVGGVLAPTPLARSVRYRAASGSAEELLHWLDVADRSGAAFVPVGSPGDYRGAEDDSDLDLAGRLDLVAALLERSPGRQQVDRLARRAVVRQAERLRELVVSDPARYADVVAGVRERRIADFPWSVVNRGRARDLAVLYSFLPFIDTSGLVAARRLREWGVVTDVISQDLGATARSDERSMRIAAEVLDETRILPGKRQVNTWASMRGFVEDALAEVAVLEAAKGSYRSVYSRAMLPASHFAAAILKLRAPSIRWVAEFSDPILQNAYGETRVGGTDDDWLRAELAEGFRRAGHAVPDSDRMFGWTELIAYAFADEIIFTNEHQRDFMLGYCADRTLAERAAGITRVMHHPQPGPELYEMARPAYPLDPGQVHIGYFGNFYPNRGLTEVTGALDALTLAERSRVQLHVFTSKPGALRVEVLEQGLADVIRVAPMFGYLEYLNLITRFDVLMINDYATSPHYVPNPYLPAKLADYRGSGTPIWALVEPGSILSAADDLAHVSTLGDVDAATAVLRALAAQKV
jgi:poly(ribitol-phosphate) beta-N-acetylglucosaminyltransferase